MFRAWQLLPRPKSLEEFNSLPFLTSNFFQANISTLFAKEQYVAHFIKF
jgi:hypothetical protein